MDTLRDQSRGGGRLVLPVGLQLADGTVVSGKSVDTGLDEDKSELGVLVLLEGLKVCANRDGLLDEAVQILGDRRSQAVLL